MEVSSPITKELEVLIESAHKKMNELIDTIKSQILEKKDDMIQNIESKDLNFEIMSSASLLAQEKFIKTYEILIKAIESLKKECKLISSSKECPSKLRAPLDTFIYTAKQTNVEQLIKYAEKIKEIYGEEYITKAENNEDNFVDENLVRYLNKKGFTFDEMKERVKLLCEERNLKIDF